MQRLIIVFWLLCLVSTLILAQGLEIAGTVSDKDSGDPLPGSTVAVKGSTITTVTNANGAFRLVVNQTEATIVFSRIGYRNTEINVTASDDNLAVTLGAAPLNTGEEMVVTGVSTSIKRQNLANAVESIPAEDLSRVPVQSLDDVLNGKFPGVQVRFNSGAPGGGASVKLRGLSTINGNAQPLYIVDGVIISNANIQSGTDFVTNATGGGGRDPQDNPSSRIADIIPYDIESVEVLKGPSAAAIYGSKASNGVVLINTHKGGPGEEHYEISFQFGKREIIKKLGQRVYTRDVAIAQWGQLGQVWFDAVANPDGTYPIQDYEEQLYGNTGDIFETNFNARGGSENTTYYISGYSLDDEGIIKRTGFTKNGIRANLTHFFSSRVSLELNTFFVRSRSDRGLVNNENNNGTTFGVALVQTPNFFDLRPDADGNYPVNPFASSNPLQTRDLMTNRETVNRTIDSMKFNWQIFSTEKQILDFNIVGGFDYFSQENEAVFPATLQFEQIKASNLPGTSILGESENTNSNLYFNLNHSLIHGSTTFNTSAGVQFENLDFNRVLIVGEGLTPGTTNVNNAAAISFTDQIRTLQRDRGFYLQEQIQLGEAIYLVGGVRGDSSSSNGDPDEFHVFPKAAFSIRLSEYDFWDGLAGVINEFKLRTAWGKTGNLPPPNVKYDSFDSVNITGSGGLLVLANKGNPLIEPETSAEFEFGFDAGILNDRATLSFSYFKQDIDNLILRQNLAPSTGFQTTFVNAGQMETDGIELTLEINPIHTQTLDWTTRFNFFTVDNVITNLDIAGFDLDNGGFAPVLGQHRIDEGRSATRIIGVENGEVVQLGDETPDFQLSWDNILAYRRWSLSWLLDWKEGGDTINLTYLLSDLNGTSPDLDTPEGQARAGAFGTTTSQLIEDSSYLKLREIRLQYEVARGPLNRWFHDRISHLRFALLGRNLWTETDYQSYDPEVSNFGNAPIGSVEVAPFPTSKAYYLQISAGL